MGVLLCLPTEHGSTHIICLMDTSGGGVDGLHSFISTGQGAAVLSWSGRKKRPEALLFLEEEQPPRVLRWTQYFHCWRWNQRSCLMGLSIVEVATDHMANLPALAGYCFHSCIPRPLLCGSR